MKLKYKIPLLFLVLTILVFLWLVGFLFLYVQDVFIRQVADQSEALVTENFEIVRKVEWLQHDSTALSHALEQMVADGRLRLEYRGKAGSFMAGKLEPGRFTVSLSLPIYEGHQRTGQLQIIRQPRLMEFGVHSLINRTVWAFIPVLIILIISFVIYFHHFITMPIQALNKRLAQIRLKRKPLPLTYKRCNEIGDLYRHVHAMEERLVQAYEEQLHMITAIAHDLKTPLTTIQGFLELLESGVVKDPAKQRETFRLLQTKTVTIQKLVEEFSAYSKQEYALIDMRTSLIRADTFFCSIAEEYEAECAGLDIGFRAHHLFGETTVLDANEEWLRRVVANLVSNAVRYAQADDLMIHFVGYVEENMAYFQIEDNGIGVPQAELPHLFNKFYTVDRARQAQTGGTGLGLAISRTIVERHGGQMEAFPSHLGGLGVRFAIPIAHP
ncbi:sensor histidine kinase [Laceyella putida]|uniref:histidine kinase n=1 Tax=Laceyella putida TaxID=110101 RepID=A0ABW2RF74_9BACL